MATRFFALNRSTIAILAGYSIEKYDMFLYGFFTIAITEIFFPFDDPKNSILFSLGVFASGYIMRPLGGIILGHLGDKYGRVKSLQISIGLAFIPPCVLTVLPTYEKIGIIAPISLIICRLFQGFCSGGEFSGAAVFLSENCPKNKTAFSVSLLRSIGFLGVVIGTGSAYISTLPMLPNWGWRIPFFLGALLTLFLYCVRINHLIESPSFKNAERNKKILDTPVAHIFKHSKKQLIYAMALTIFASTAFYMSSIYTGSLLKQEFQLPTHEILAINTAIVLIWVIFIPFLGIWADKVGIVNFLTKSIICNILFAYPLFWLLDKYFSLANFIFFQLFFGLLSASFYAPFAEIVPKIFKVEERYSGVALSITIVQALWGGLIPMISILLVNWTQDKKTPAFLLIFSAFIALIGIIKLKTFLLEQEVIRGSDEKIKLEFEIP